MIAPDALYLNARMGVRMPLANPLKQETEMNMDFTDQERDLLVSILEQYLSALREEVYKTETSSVKDELKQEELTVKDLLGRFRSAI